MKKFSLFKPKNMETANLRKISDSEWEYVSTPSSDEDKSLFQSNKQTVVVNNDQLCRTTDIDKPNGNSELSKAMPSSSNIEGRTREHLSHCSGKCQDIIEEQQKTISSLANTIEQLRSQIKIFEKNAATSTLSLQTSSTNAKTRSYKLPNANGRPSSDSAIYLLSIDELKLMNIVEDSKKFRKRRRSRNIRKTSGDALPSIAVLPSYEAEQMNKLQKNLSNRVYGEDIYKMIRHFSSNPEPFIADLKRIETSYEQFQQAFVELRKLGSDKFNPLLIYKYFKNIGYNQCAEMVEPFLLEQSNKTQADTEEN